MSKGKARKPTRRQAIRAWKRAKDAAKARAPMLDLWVEDEQKRQAEHLRAIANS